MSLTVVEKLLPGNDYWEKVLLEGSVMPRSRQRLIRSSRIALLVALGTGLSQGVGVIAGYVTGLEGRALAVFILVSVTSVIALAPEALKAAKKNTVLAQQY
jgi:D-alanyl-D-alanine carboxypeptidase